MVYIELMNFSFLLCSLPIFSGSFFKNPFTYLPKRKSQNFLIEQNITTPGDIIQRETNLITLKELQKRTVINIIVMGLSVMIFTFPYKVYDD
jgi:hypothetical protein